MELDKNRDCRFCNGKAPDVIVHSDDFIWDYYFCDGVCLTCMKGFISKAEQIIKEDSQ